MQSQTYKKIILIGYELFSDKGYDATGMMDIARAVGIAKSTLYHHFPSKEALLLKIFDECIIKRALALFPQVASITKDNYQKTLIDMGLLYIDQAKKDKRRRRFNLQVFMLLGRIRDLKSYFEPLMAETFQYIGSIIEKGIELDLIIPNIDRELTAQKFFMVLDVAELYAAFEIGFRLEDIWIDFVDKLVERKK